VTVVRFFIAPLKDIGGAFSEFIRQLFKDLPLTMYPVAMVMVGGFVFMLLFMMFGYSFETFFLTIRQSRSLVASDGHLQQTIQDNSEKMQQQVDVHYLCCQAM